MSQLDEQAERELLERFLRWWLTFPARPLKDLVDDAERDRRVREGVDEFVCYEFARRPR